MAGNIGVKFTANTAGFSKGVSAVKSGIGGVVGMVGKLVAPIMGAVGAVGLLGAAWKGVSLAADMESTTVAFQTIIGDAEKTKQVMAELTNLAAKTPYEFENITGAARQLINILKPEDLTNSVRMLGDVASGVNQPIEDIAAAYAKAINKGKVQGETLEQLGERSVPILKELGRVMGVGADKVAELGSEGKISGEHLTMAFENMTNKGGVFFQMMEKQSGTFNGLMSTLKDAFNGLMREFGEPIMQELKPILTDLINVLNSGAGFAKEFGTGIAMAIRVLYNAFKRGELGNLLMQTLKAGFAVGVDALLKGVFAAGELIKGVFTSAISSLTDPNLWKGLWKIFDGLGMLLSSKILKVLGKDKLAEGTAMIAENLFNRGSSLMQKSGDGGAAYEEGKRKALEKLSEGPGDNAARELGILLLLLKDLKTPIQEVKKSVEGSGKVNTKTLAPTDGTKKEGSPKASENNWLTSLARIGGAAALTNGASNPLVTLQKQANNLLASIDRNTRNRTTGTATFA